MPKRSADETDQVIPDGFKVHNDRIVSEIYKQIDLDNIEVKKYYLGPHPTENTLKKITAHVPLEAFEEEDQEWLKSIDASLSEAAKLENAKHCPLIKDELVKVTGQVKMGKKKYTELKKNDKGSKMNITGTFMLTSVYKHAPSSEDPTYYGINLVGNAKNARSIVLTCSQ